MTDTKALNLSDITRGEIMGYIISGVAFAVMCVCAFMMYSCCVMGGKHER